jgi:protein-S-isoprenylcysteine O-methyltransferase Ste14
VRDCVASRSSYLPRVSKPTNRADEAGVRFPPPLIFVLMAVLGLGADRLFGLPLLDLGGARWIASGILALIGSYLLAAALMRFRKVGTRPEPWQPTTTIATHGIYGRTRNPMYLGMTALQVAMAIVVFSLGALLTTVVSLAIVDRYVIGREERYLERKFGSAYLAYKARVRRWL